MSLLVVVTVTDVCVSYVRTKETIVILLVNWFIFLVKKSSDRILCCLRRVLWFVISFSERCDLHEL